MSEIPYIDLAALLIEGSTVVSPDDRCGPEETVEAIMDALSLTQLREHILLHLTIDNWAVDYEQPPTDLDLPRHLRRQDQREQAAERC